MLSAAALPSAYEPMYVCRAMIVVDCGPELAPCYAGLVCTRVKVFGAGMVTPCDL